MATTTGRRTDSGRGGNGGVGNVVMKASRSEAASPGRSPLAQGEATLLALILAEKAYSLPL
jgi:hypothetical protein